MILIRNMLLTKSRANVRMLEELGWAPSFGKNKAQLLPASTTYWEIKHDICITLQVNDLKSEKFRVRNLKLARPWSGFRRHNPAECSPSPKSDVPSRQ